MIDLNSDFGLVVAEEPAACCLCGRSSDERPILITEDIDLFTSLASGALDTVDTKCGVCEPCAYLAGWRWRMMSDEVAAPPFPREPKVVHVLIVRQRSITALTTTQVKVGGEFVPEEREKQISDPVIPRDILMVRRKEDPSSFALPGGKVEPGEAPLDAAVRELKEETGLHTWPAALELLHAGFTARTGKLAVVYLCRAYSGEPSTQEEGVDVEWKPGSPLAHSTSYRGYYIGVDLALNMRIKIQEISGANAPLCGRLGKAGRSYLDMVTTSGEDLSPDDRGLLKGYEFAMSGEEKQSAEVVYRQRPRREPAPVARAAAAVDDDADEEAEADSEDVPS